MATSRKSKEEVLAGMNQAAEDALSDFEAIKAKHPEAVGELAAWWEKNFRAAGHKRLAYTLMGKEI